MICWYASLSSGTLVITVDIKSKSLEAEYDNLVNLNSGSFINPFVVNAPFLYSLKTSENRKVF